MQLNEKELLRQQAFVNGRWIDADNLSTAEVFNPSTLSVIATVPSLGAAETRRAIEAASRAFDEWKTTTARQRADILRCWFELILQHKKDLAILLTREQGKPLAEADGEVVYAASFVEWFAEEARRVYGEIIPANSTDRKVLVMKQPAGVAAAITPWNFPCAMITRKVAPALAAGCSVIVKPAPQTPLSALALAELAHRAGVPAGVLNVLTGDAAVIGGELTASPVVRKLSFTGSTAVGRLLLKQCADTVKKVSMELGGHAPFIVFDDADVESAVEGALASKFRTSGQTCVCANRIFLQDGIHDVFVERLIRRVQALKVGDGFEAGVEQGPLIDMAAVAKVEDHVSDAVARGAHVITGGKRHALGGSFYEPSILTGITPDMKICHEETFGPVAPILRFSSDEEAVRMANDSEYGLASYFYSRDIGRIMRVAEQLEYGMVGINAGILSAENVPFGGVKSSGIGREGSHYGIEEYLEIKYLCLAGLGQP